MKANPAGQGDRRKAMGKERGHGGKSNPAGRPGAIGLHRLFHSRKRLPEGRMMRGVLSACKMRLAKAGCARKCMGVHIKNWPGGACIAAVVRGKAGGWRGCGLAFKMRLC